jgi:pimeloyl-ACP methyl ester carboxylesterase
MPVTFDDQSITIGGCQLRIRVRPGPGPQCFFFHGNSGGATLFDEVCAGRLGENISAVAVDFPGHGASAPGVPAELNYSLPALAGLLDQLVATLRSGPFVLVGHSLGGHAVLESRSLHSAAAVVLISAPPLTVDSLGSTFLPDPCAGALFRSQLSDDDVESFARCLVSAERCPPQVLAQLKASIRATDGEFRQSLGRSIQQGQLRNEAEAVSRLRSPLLLLHGGRDAFVRQEAYVAAPLGKSALSRRVQLEDVGHSPHLECPAEVEREVSSFLRAALTEPRTTSTQVSAES